MPTSPRSKDDQPLEPEGIGTTEDPTKAEDTEGHMFLPDVGTSRQLAKSRSAEIEREMRERQRQKEARPNRR